MLKKNNEQLVAWTKIVMICAGLWNQPISENWVAQNLYVIFSIFVNLSYHLCTILFGLELIRLIMNNYPFEIIITSVSVLLTCFKITIKLLIYMKYNVLDMFREIISKEREVWESNEEIKNIYRAKIRICRLIVGCFVGGAIGTVTVLQLTGAYATIQLRRFNNANNATLEPHFMLLSWFPRDKLKNLGVTFSSQVLWAYVGIFYTSSSILIILTLLMYAVSRLEILQIRFKNFIEPNFNQDCEEEMKEKIIILKNLIREHKYIIGYVQHLNMCIKNVLMIEFLLSSMEIASVSVNILKLEMAEAVWLLVFSIYLANQIFIVGWTCNEIKVQSETIETALYESRWYLLNKEGRQLVQIIMARAQKPLTITIGPFGPMTTNSSIMIFKAAYSYISIMRE